MKSKMFLYRVLFALSGFAALIYEGMWAKYLKLMIGHSSYGQILTLMVFMGGLAIGSFISARFVDRVRSPLMWYVFIEFFIGMFGLIFHHQFVYARNILWTSGVISGQGAIVSTSVSVALGMLLTMPQAILLGATFPFAVDGILRDSNSSNTGGIPSLYFANSVGGALGILITSYCLVPLYGLPGTLTFAGLLNVFIAVSFYFIRDKNAVNNLKVEILTRNEETKVNVIPVKIWIFLFVSFGTGLSSFFYEIGWIRLLALVLGSSSHAFDLMVAAFILGLGAGAYYIWRNPSFGREVERLAKAQLFMGGIAAMGLFGAEWLFRIQHASFLFLIHSPETWGVNAVLQLFLCMLLMCPASFFAGMTLPLLTTCLVESTGRKSYLGHVYGWNTLGAIIGASVSGLVLLPLVGVSKLIVLGALIDVGLGVLLLSKIGRIKNGKLYAILSLLIAVMSIFVVLPDKMLVSGGFRVPRKNAMIESDSLWVTHGRTATVSVAQYGVTRVIATNGKPDGSVNMSGRLPDRDLPLDELTQAMCAWLPMAYHSMPKNVAMIGMGTGMSAHFLMADKRVKKLDLIEIEPEMINMAQRMRPKNERVFIDTRIKKHIEDARTFLSRSGEKYDVIISEPSNPWVSGVSSLFTTEFYHEMNRHLATNGVLLQWVQAYEFNDVLFASILQSLRTEYRYVRIHAVDLTSDLIFIASNSPLNSDFGSLMVDSVKGDLKSLRKNPQAIISESILGTERLLDLMTGFSNQNSEFYPLVDLNAERAMFAKENVAFVNSLVLKDVPLQRWIEPGWDSIQKKKNQSIALKSSSLAIRAVGFRPSCFSHIDSKCWDRYLDNLMRVAPISTWRYSPGGISIVDSLKGIVSNLPDTSLALYVKWRLGDTSILPDSMCRYRAAKLLRDGLVNTNYRNQVLWASLFWGDPVAIKLFQKYIREASDSKLGVPLEMYVISAGLVKYFEKDKGLVQ